MTAFVVRHSVLTAVVGWVLALFLNAQAQKGSTDGSATIGTLTVLTGLLFTAPLIMVLIQSFIRWVARTAHEATKDEQ